jgi:hypothetical protein
MAPKCWVVLTNHIKKVRTDCACDACTSCEGHASSACQGEHVFCIILCHDFFTVTVVNRWTQISKISLWIMVTDTVFKSCFTSLLLKYMVKEKWMKGMRGNVSSSKKAGQCMSAHCYLYTHMTWTVFLFQALNFLVESFGLLIELFPFPSILDAGYPVFYFHLAEVLFDVILPSVLGSSLWSFH